MYENDATMMGQSTRAKAILVARQGAQAGMSFPLTSNVMTLGREEGANIVLHDPESSRNHAKIGWQGGQFVIEDMGSTNGTFVNGIQITSPQVLAAGDSIGIGQTALVFQIANTNSFPQYTMPPTAYGSENTAQADEEDNTLQYILYALGLVFLIGICFLSSLIGLILIYPQLFGNMLGL